MNSSTQPPHNNELPRYHCYGRTAACCVEVTLVDHERRLVVDCANLQRSGNVPKVDWRQKISFMLTDQETPILAALVFGYAGRIKIARGGKTLELERQPPKVSGGNGALYVKAYAATRLITLPIGPGDLYWIGIVVVNYLSQLSGCSTETVIQSIRGIHNLIGLPSTKDNG